MTNRAIAAAVGLLLSTGCGMAMAAGGHHGVDDATILDAGTCELESWFTRSDAGERLLHAGAGCRVGPVELRLSAERVRQDGAGRTGYGIEAKWAREWLPGFSAGLSLTVGWEAQARPRYHGSTLAGLATWTPRDDLALHLNLGRDFLNDAAGQQRSGVAVEWAPRAGWSVTVERYLEDGTHFLRAGLRRTVNEDWSVDVSRAYRLQGSGESNWTIGMSRLLRR
ncbi:MAG: hypothetical protein JWQ07_4603 [Ramlibacter sp.]|nr:hypothetical protein [Ramlibacter sp.]